MCAHTVVLFSLHSPASKLPSANREIFSVVSVAAAVLFHDDYLPAMLDRGNISSFISLAHLCSTIAASMNEIKLRYLYMLNHNSLEFIY